MSLNHFRIRLFTTEDGCVPGEERIYRRRARGVFSLEHDNSMVCFRYYGVAIFSSVEPELRTDGESELSTLAISPFFPHLLVCIYMLSLMLTFDSTG